ncbi:MAG: branched-chain amino acid ABC transporter permease, partial [Actinomycetes bacterium]
VSVVATVFVLNKFLLTYLNSDVQKFFNSWFSLSSLAEIMIWILMALGLNIIVGYAGLLDLGYVAFWALGGYVAGWLMSPFFSSLQFNFFGHARKGFEFGIHIHVLIVLILGGCFTAIWGVIIGGPTLRLKSDYLALVTLGFGEIIPQFMLNGSNIAGHNVTNGAQGIGGLDEISLFGYVIGTFAMPEKFLMVSILAGGMIFFSIRLRDGRLGRAWLAIREDELAASMMGVPLWRTKFSSYSIGAVSGGVGGVAFAILVGGVYADRFNFVISIIILSMVVLGGMGNVWGVVVGATVLSWINSIGLVQVGDLINNTFGTHVNFPSYQFLIFGLLLVLMMLFRREGFLPEARMRMVMQDEKGDVDKKVSDETKIASN